MFLPKYNIYNVTIYKYKLQEKSIHINNILKYSYNIIHNILLFYM